MAAIEDRRTEAGDQLERLYEEHGDRVRAICLGLLRDRHEAEDAAQQVFLSALRSLHNGTVPRDAGAWLATISRRECWARARQPTVAPLHAGLHDARAEDPSTSALSRAELDETWRTVAGLPGRQREALLLREVRGLGYDELAEDMQLSRPSVRSLLTRARRTLRAQLERGAAVLTGGPWLNMFPRLFADGSNPAFSSVGRTAAVGLGAVALTGGAVVAPRLVAPSQAHRAPARASVPHRARVARRSPGLASPAAARMHEMARFEDIGTTTDRHGGRSGSGSERGHDAGNTSQTSSGSGSTSSGSGGSGSSGRDGGTDVSTGGELSVTSSGSSGGPGPDSSGSSSGSGSHDSSDGSSTTVTTVTTVSTSEGGSGTSGSDGSGSSSGSGSSGSSGGSSDGLDGRSSGSDGGH